MINVSVTLSNHSYLSPCVCSWRQYVLQEFLITFFLTAQYRRFSTPLLHVPFREQFSHNLHFPNSLCIFKFPSIKKIEDMKNIQYNSCPQTFWAFTINVYGKFSRFFLVEALLQSQSVDVFNAVQSFGLQRLFHVLLLLSLFLFIRFLSLFSSEHSFLSTWRRSINGLYRCKH